MKINQLKNLLDEFGDNVIFEYDLKKKNWFNIGGKSKVFYKANNLKELINFLKKVADKEKIFILGAGSNTLITDDLYDGIVIKLSKDFNNISSILSSEMMFLDLVDIKIATTASPKSSCGQPITALSLIPSISSKINSISFG